MVATVFLAALVTQIFVCDVDGARHVSERKIEGCANRVIQIDPGVAKATPIFLQVDPALSEKETTRITAIGAAPDPFSKVVRVVQVNPAALEADVLSYVVKDKEYLFVIRRTHSRFGPQGIESHFELHDPMMPPQEVPPGSSIVRSSHLILFRFEAALHGSINLPAQFPLVLRPLGPGSRYHVLLGEKGPPKVNASNLDMGTFQPVAGWPTEPKPVISEPDTYRWDVHVNAYADEAYAWKGLEPLVEAYKLRNGFTTYTATNRFVSYYYEYTIRFAR